MAGEVDETLRIIEEAAEAVRGSVGKSKRLLVGEELALIARAEVEGGEEDLRDLLGPAASYADHFQSADHFARFAAAVLAPRAVVKRVGEYVVVYQPGRLRRLAEALLESDAVEGLAADRLDGDPEALYESEGIRLVQEVAAHVENVARDFDARVEMTPLVVGVNRESGLAFAVRPPALPAAILGIAGEPSEPLVRAALGFDLHEWEYGWEAHGRGGGCGPYAPAAGVRVRLQGDVVLDVDCWLSEEELPGAVEEHLKASVAAEWAASKAAEAAAAAVAAAASLPGGLSPSVAVAHLRLAVLKAVDSAAGISRVPELDVQSLVNAFVSENPYDAVAEVAGRFWGARIRPLRLGGFRAVIPVVIDTLDVTFNGEALRRAAPGWASATCSLVHNTHNDVKASLNAIDPDRVFDDTDVAGSVEPSTPLASLEGLTALVPVETTAGPGVALLVLGGLYCFLLYTAAAELARREPRLPGLREELESRRAARPGPTVVRIERHEAGFHGSLIAGPWADLEYVASRYAAAVRALSEPTARLVLRAASGAGRMRALSRSPDAAAELARAVSLVASVKTGVPLVFADASSPLTLDHPEHGVARFRLPSPLKARLTTLNTS